jgi:hypothetical protein
MLRQGPIKEDWPMETFAQKFCRMESCRPDEFSSRMFWSCLYRQAIPLAPVLARLRHGEYFHIDRDLIKQVGAAVTLDEIRRETQEFAMDSRNRGWLRRRARLRVSAGRLLALAERHLAGNASVPSAARRGPLTA